MHTNKVKYFSILIIISVLVTSGCTKDKIENIEPIRVNSNDGLIVKNEKDFILLEVSISEIEPTDSVMIENHKFTKYNLEISGQQAAIIEPGHLIINPEGKGSLILITEVTPYGVKSTSGNEQIQGVFAKGVTATLDLLFNYEGAILQFSTKINRTKENTSIEGKILNNVIDDDKRKFEINTDGEKGLSFTYTDYLKFLFNGTKFKLKPKDSKDDDEVSASLTINEGFIAIKPALDFLIEYNPKYIKYSDNKWINFANYLNIQKQIVDKSLAVGTLKQLKAIVYTDFDYGIDIELEIAGKIENEIYEKKIGQWCRIFPLGPVPIGHQTTLSLEVDLSAAGALTSHGWFKQQHNIVLGFDLKNSLSDEGLLDPQVVYYTEMSTNTDKGVTLTAEIKLAAGITLKLKDEIYIVGVLGPTLTGKAILETYAEFWNYPNYKNALGWRLGVDVELKGEASVDLSLFHIDKATWRFLVSKPFRIARWNIYQYPYKLNIISGDKQSGPIGCMLGKPIQFEVQDNFGLVPKNFLPVPVFSFGKEFSGYNGHAAASPVISSNGLANVNWVLDNQIGSQKLLAGLLDSEGDFMGETTVVSATGVLNNDPPNVIETVPANGASGFDINSNIEIFFSKDIFFSPSSAVPKLKNGIAKLWNSDNIEVPFDAQIVSGNKIVINPLNPLKPGEFYTLKIFPEIVHDILGTVATADITDIIFSTLDESGLTIEIKDILPENILNIINEMGIVINGGNNPPNVENTYLCSPNVLYKSNISNDKIGMIYGSQTIKLYEQNQVNLSIKIRESQAGATGEGSGSFIVGEGNKFSIVGENLRRNPDNSQRCKLAFIISGEIAEGGIENYHYTLIMIDDFGDPNNSLIEIGQLREFYDEDGFSETVMDIFTTQKAGTFEKLMDEN